MHGVILKLFGLLRAIGGGPVGMGTFSHLVEVAELVPHFIWLTRVRYFSVKFNVLPLLPWPDMLNVQVQRDDIYGWKSYQPYQCGTPEPCPTEPRLSTLPMCKISAQCLIAPRLWKRSKFVCNFNLSKTDIFQLPLAKDCTYHYYVDSLQ